MIEMLIVGSSSWLLLFLCSRSRFVAAHYCTICFQLRDLAKDWLQKKRSTTTSTTTTTATAETRVRERRIWLWVNRTSRTSMRISTVGNSPCMGERPCGGSLVPTFSSPGCRVLALRLVKSCDTWLLLNVFLLLWCFLNWDCISVDPICDDALFVGKILLNVSFIGVGAFCLMLLAKECRSFDR